MTPHPGDPRLRFRTWVDGELVNVTWIDCSNPDFEDLADRLADRHADIIREADQHGRHWLIEMYDPAMPDHAAYARRGSATAGIIIDPRRPW